MLYKELVYICLDLLKGLSDDFTYTEEHVIFLLNKYRSTLLKSKYADVKKQIPEANYQTICLDLIEVPAISGEPCEGGDYLRTTNKVPTMLPLGSTTLYPIDFYLGIYITYISRERMRFVGHNKYMKNIIYASLGPDNYIYFKSSNPQYLQLEKVRLSAVFDDAEEASNLQCLNENCETICDILDRDFPLEAALVQPLIEAVVKELSGSIYKPKDPNNNANDDLASIATYLRNNVKSDLQKQIES